MYPWQARGKDRVTDVTEACIGHVGRQEVTQGEITLHSLVQEEMQARAGAGGHRDSHS